MSRTHRHNAFFSVFNNNNNNNKWLPSSPVEIKYLRINALAIGNLLIRPLFGDY